MPCFSIVRRIHFLNLLSLVSFLAAAFSCLSPRLDNPGDPSTGSFWRTQWVRCLIGDGLCRSLSVNPPIPNESSPNESSPNASSSNKDITSYSLPSLGIQGIISGSIISLSSDSLTSIGSYIARFSTTGESVEIGGVIQRSDVSLNSYSNNLTYTVRARDGTTKDYSISLSAPRSYASSSLRVWLKADSLSLNDGDSVGTWNDLSGFGNHFSQGNAPQRPIYKTAQIGSLPSLQFRIANSQRLDITGGTGLYVSNSGSLFLVIKVLGTSASGTTLLNIHGGNGREFALQHPNGEFVVCRNALGCNQISALQNPLNSYLAIGSIQDANVTVNEIWNGDTKGSISAAGGVFDYVAGGSPGSGYLSNGNLDADIAEVLFYNTAVSSNERDKIFCYLRAKYKLTATSTSCGI